MPNQATEPYLLRNVGTYVRIFLRAALPVPDIVDRYPIRRLAKSLIQCEPWPGMNASGVDAAQLAMRSSSSDVASALLRVSDDLLGLLASASDDLLRFTLGVGDRGVGRLLGEHYDLRDLIHLILAAWLSAAASEHGCPFDSVRSCLSAKRASATDGRAARACIRLAGGTSSMPFPVNRGWGSLDPLIQPTRSR